MAGLVIIGAGECGIRAAFSARSSGYPGKITVITDEPGLPYDRTALSKPVQGAPVLRPICLGDDLDRERIALHCGRPVVRIERATKTVVISGGGAVRYETLLLATGSEPIRPKVKGAERAHVLRTVKDAERLFCAAAKAKSVAIIGAGLIGLELAAKLSELGLRVDVVTRGTRVLERSVPEPLSKRLVERHRLAGVTFTFSARIDSISRFGLVLDDGRLIPGDEAVFATGVTPNVALAEAAGLDVQNGICVSTSLRTSDPAILAAGDCAARLMPGGDRKRSESWSSARAQGEFAGRMIAGVSGGLQDSGWYWTDQYDLGFQAFGDISGNPDARRVCGGDGEVLFFLSAEGSLRGAAGLGTGNTTVKDLRLAEKLWQLGAIADPQLLSDEKVNLRAFLREQRAT